MAQQQQRYKVVERIAAGGMAEVYRAESAGLEGFKKTVAIKRVLPHLSEKKQFIGLFLDEARLSAHLNHSNCVQVFDIGVGDNTYFIVMEFVDGSDLKAILEHLNAHNERMPVGIAIHICCRICEGLSYAHEARDNRGRLLGIVHRDISPPNVLITRYGEVKVVDFGLAKANSQLQESEPGVIKGKFSYLSPEAARGESVDLRTDIFAVGIILWEMLAGRRLFLGETDLQTVRQVQAANIPDLRRFNPEVPDELAQILARTLTADPNQRYQSAHELGTDLNKLLFRMGRAVSSFDVSELVAEVVEDRDRKKKEQKKSIIGTLIEDAMMEFTSLQPENSQNRFKTLHSTTTSMASQPLDSLQANDWASDLGVGAAPSEPVTGSYAIGNLSALEDEPGAHHTPMRTAPPPVGSMPVSPMTPPPPPPPGQRPSVTSAPPIPLVTEPKESKKMSTGTIVVIAALVAAAGAAGAFLAGLF